MTNVDADGDIVVVVVVAIHNGNDPRSNTLVVVFSDLFSAFSGIHWRAFLQAKMAIPPEAELRWDYGVKPDPRMPWTIKNL